MAFAQKLFTSLQNYNNPDTRIGELNRIWYDSNTNVFRIQLDKTTPGGTIIGFSGVTYKGLYNVTTNTPAISDATGLAGWEYTVLGSGTRNFGNGPIVMQDGDLLIHNGLHYDLIPGPRTQLQANWTETNSSLASFILNKPTLLNTVTPNTLNSTTHIVGNISGDTLTLSTDATPNNTPSTIVVRDANGSINVNGWVVRALTTTVNYSLNSDDYWIGTLAKGLTITLPNASNGAVNGRQYQIADALHSGNPGTNIAAQSPTVIVGNQPSQQSQITICTYVNGYWYCC
jgi:hypothetical protein